MRKRKTEVQGRVRRGEGGGWASKRPAKGLQVLGEVRYLLLKVGPLPFIAGHQVLGCARHTPFITMGTLSSLFHFHCKMFVLFVGSYLLVSFSEDGRAGLYLEPLGGFWAVEPLSGNIRKNCKCRSIASKRKVKNTGSNSD